MSKKNKLDVSTVEPASLVLTQGKNTPQQVQANIQKLLDYHGYQLIGVIVKVPMPVQMPGQQAFTAYVDVAQIQIAPLPQKITE